MAGETPDLSIVIPAYCEARRIGDTLDTLASFLQRDSFFKTLRVEVLVVAADAPDKTAEIAAAKAERFRQFKLLQPGSRVGKGRDVQFGMQRAKGKLVMFMDADVATPLHHLQEFYQACHHADVVIGTRNLITYRRGLAHGIFTYLGNALYRFTGGVQVEDTQCGFKMFTANAAQCCFGKLTILDWGFDMELLAIARAQKLQVKAIRIDDWQDKPYSTHHETAVKLLWRPIAQHMRITFNYVRGIYKS